MTLPVRPDAGSLASTYGARLAYHQDRLHMVPELQNFDPSQSSSCSHENGANEISMPNQSTLSRQIDLDLYDFGLLPEINTKATVQGKRHESHELACRTSSPSLSPSPSQPATRKPTKRTPHRIVESRYRQNINIQIERLKAKLSQRNEQLEDVTRQSPYYNDRYLSKPVVIAGAVQYIERLEKERQQLESSVKALKQQVETLREFVSYTNYSASQFFELDDFGVNGFGS